MVRGFAFFALVFLSNTSFSQGVTGTYSGMKVASFNEDKVPLSQKQLPDHLPAILYIKPGNSFVYSNGRFEFASGRWLQKDSSIYFFPEDTKSNDRACHGLNLVKVEKHHTDSLVTGKAVSVIDVSDDSTQFAGISILSNGKTYVLGDNKPILLSTDDLEIELEFLSYKLRYLFDSPMTNTYKLFVCFGLKKEDYLETRLPFDQLFFKEGKLVNSFKSILFVKQ